MCAMGYTPPPLCFQITTIAIMPHIVKTPNGGHVQYTTLSQPSAEQNTSSVNVLPHVYEPAETELKTIADK